MQAGIAQITISYLKILSDYREAQNKVDAAYRDRLNWARKCLMNIANAGKFSSDRTIMEYADEIWNITPKAHSRK